MVTAIDKKTQPGGGVRKKKTDRSNLKHIGDPERGEVSLQLKTENAAESSVALRPVSSRRLSAENQTGGGRAGREETKKLGGRSTRQAGLYSILRTQGE